MTTLIALAKTFPPNFSVIQRQLGLANFYPAKMFMYMYMYTVLLISITRIHLGHQLYTVFIRIVATATTNFSLAGVWLLIEGSSYSRAAFINCGAVCIGVVNAID